MNRFFDSLASLKEAFSQAMRPRRYRLMARLPDPGETESWEVIDTYDTPVEAIRGCSQCHDLIRNLLLRHSDPAGEAYRRIRLHDGWQDRWLVWFDEGSGEVRFDPALFEGPVPLEALPEP